MMFKRLRSGGKRLLDMGLESARPRLEPFIKPIRETREAIGAVLDRNKVIIGHRIDRAASKLIKGVAQMIRPRFTSVVEAEQRWAERQAPFTEDKLPPDTKDRWFLTSSLRKVGDAIYHWGEEMDRTPPLPGSDQEVASYEEKTHERYNSDIEQEENVSTIPQQPADRLVEQQFLHQVNKHRSLPALSFPQNHRLSQLAQKRASYYLHYPDSNTAPLHLSYYRPLRRDVIKKELADMSPEDHELVFQHEQQTDGSRLYHLHEPVSQYAERARQRQSKANAMDYQEFSTVFDLEDGGYPDDGHFELALEEAMKRPAFAELIRDDDVRIAFGFCRKGTKAALTCFAIRDPSLQVEARPLVSDEVSEGHDWWLEQIPEHDRGEGSLWARLTEQIGGYSSYVLYDFFRKIRELRRDHHPPLQIDHPEDIQEFRRREEKNLFGSNRETLKFSLRVNGRPEEIQLIVGTDKFLTSPESLYSKGEFELETEKKKKRKREGELVTAEDYLEKITDRLKEIETNLEGEEVTNNA